MRHLRVIVIGEVLEWRGCGELLALEEHRDKRRGEHQCRRDLCAIDADDVLEPLACCTVAHLVVVLDVAEETVRGEPIHGTAVAAPAVREYAPS